MIKKIIKKLLSVLPLTKTIIFESYPDFTDNTYPLFIEIINNEYFKKYKIIWWTSENKKELSKRFNRKIITINKNNFINKIRFFYYTYTSKVLICCNRYLFKKNPKQILFYLTHGLTVKSVRDYYNTPKCVDYFLSTSKHFEDMQSYQFKIEKEKIISLGYPRNDYFFNSSVDITKLFDKQYKKYIIWYPTFRQHKGNKISHSSISLPIIHDVEKAKIVNESAKENDVLIILKPHFAQDMSLINGNDFSNIVIINDDFYKKNNIQAYEFLSKTDALISDYSSVYFDYLFANKPIALTFEDFEEYSKNPGFAIDMNKYMAGGIILDNEIDMCDFIKDVANNIDPKEEIRNEIKDLVFDDISKGASKRVTNFIIKKIKES